MSLMDTTQFISVFVTLFVIIDPIAVAPIFVALTRGMDPGQRRASALRAALVAVGVLTAFGLFGDKLLKLAGISLDAFRISGGILLFLIAVEMLFERRTARRKNQVNDGHDPAVFPIAVPLMAGPGAMATMVLFATAPESDWSSLIIIHAIMISVIIMTFALCLAGTWLDKFIGANGINVLTRLFGILLAALSVQIVLDGLAAYGLVRV